MISKVCESIKGRGGNELEPNFLRNQIETWYLHKWLITNHLTDIPMIRNISLD